MLQAPMQSESTDARLLRLHPADNVLTVIAKLEEGARVSVDGVCLAIAKALPIGHKIAARAIGAGEKIIKYGAPIGSATEPIAAGAHVHTHNLQSDYLPTFRREDQARYFEAGRHPAKP
jgi:altronate dehydratase small subunit